MRGYRVTAMYFVHDGARRHALYARSIPWESYADAETDQAEVIARGDLSATTRFRECRIESLELEPNTRYRSAHGGVRRVPGPFAAARL